LIHAGADDGKFHTFVSGGTLRIQDSDFTITATSEDNQISVTEQNDDFTTISVDFLDFTEANPFGDPN